MYIIISVVWTFETEVCLGLGGFLECRTYSEKTKQKTHKQTEIYPEKARIGWLLSFIEDFVVLAYCSFTANIALI